MVASGYLLLPIREATGTFFRRRFTRVLVPFLLWSAIYVFYFHAYIDLGSLVEKLLLLASILARDTYGLFTCCWVYTPLP